MRPAPDFFADRRRRAGVPDSILESGAVSVVKAGATASATEETGADRPAVPVFSTPCGVQVEAPSLAMARRWASEAMLLTCAAPDCAPCRAAERAFTGGVEFFTGSESPA